jgi:Protein of unknown function (DUF2946)
VEQIAERTGLRAWRRTAVVLALAAMMVRAVLPAGWMPSSQGLASGAPIVICTQTGEKHIVLDAHGKPVPAEQQDENPSHPPCAFAAAAALSLPTVSAEIAPILAVAAATVVAKPAAPTHVAISRAWRSRAPPSGFSA